MISLKDALLIVATRARLVLKKCAKLTTGMVAISLSPEVVQTLLNAERCFADLSIACFNSPRECVVSGPLSAIRRFMQHIDNENPAKTTQLDALYGYHSSAMSAITDDLVIMSQKLKINPTQLPFISAALGKIVMPGDETFPPQDYFARHCVEPVRFTGAVESYLGSSIFCKSAVYLEVGPHPTVLGLLRSFPALSGAKFVGSLRKCQEPSVSLPIALATVYVSNCSVDWRNAFRDMGSATCIDLPPYPFACREFWTPYVEESISSSLLPRRTKYSLLRNWSQYPGKGVDRMAIFETPLEDLQYYIKGHRVGGIPLCPASVYLELAYAAIHLSFEYLTRPSDDDNFVLRQLYFLNPLTWKSTGEDPYVELSIAVGASKGAFSVKSRASEAAVKIIHAKGTYDIRPISETREFLASFQLVVERSIDSLLHPESGNTPDTFSARTTYEVVFPRVVEYSKAFHTLRSLTISSDGMEATAVMQLGPTYEAGQFVVNPLFLDTLLHIAGFLSNLRGNLEDAYICNEIGAIHVLPDYFVDRTASFTVYCKISNFPNQNCTIGETYARKMGSDKLVVAYLEGIRFQRVRLSGLKAGLATISGRCPSLAPPLQSAEGGTMTCFNQSKDEIYNIIARVCAMEPEDILLDHHFDQLGIDSLMRQQLSYELSKAFPAFAYNSQELSRCNIVKDLVDIVLAASAIAPPKNHFYTKSPRTPISLAPSYLSSSATLVHHWDNTSSPVRRILANVLDMDEGTINDDSELDHIGLDSFASMEALHALQREYNLEAPRSVFSGSRTVRDVEHQILKLEPSYLPSTSPGWSIPGRLAQNSFEKMCDALSVNKPLSLLQGVSSKLPPLILIHDGSGLTISYERLSSLNRRVWAISNPRFSTSDPWSGVVEMARFYADLIFNEIEGPMIVGGQSFICNVVVAV